MLQILDAIFNGISIGSVLLVSALGLAIVFGLMGVINLAHGELMMLGAYTTFVVQNIFKGLGESWFNLYIFFALIAAFIVTGIAGLILERGVIRYLYGRPLETLLATWGVSLILQQFVRSVNWVLMIGILLFCGLFFGGLWFLSKRSNWQRIRNAAMTVLFILSAGISVATGIFLSQTYKLAVTKPWFGAQNVNVTAPAWLRGWWEPPAWLRGWWDPIENFRMPYTRLFIIGLTILCLIGIYLFLNRSSWGLRIRSVTQNRNMSACLGIPTAKVDALTFALGSGLAGIAGCAISLLGPVGPNTGQNYVVDTFMVVVVGGVGKLIGSVVAALGIGTANYLIGSGTITNLLKPLMTSGWKPAEYLYQFFGFFSTISMAKVLVFILIIAFLQVKPAGIFPQKGRTIDA